MKIWAKKNLVTTTYLHSQECLLVKAIISLLLNKKKRVKIPFLMRFQLLLLVRYTLLQIL
jgi:hypothetical protein